MRQLVAELGGQVTQSRGNQVWVTAWASTDASQSRLDNGWQVSAGYIYCENADPNRHYKPLIILEHQYAPDDVAAYE